MYIEDYLFLQQTVVLMLNSMYGNRKLHHLNIKELLVISLQCISMGVITNQYLFTICQ